MYNQQGQFIYPPAPPMQYGQGQVYQTTPNQAQQGNSVFYASAYPMAANSSTGRQPGELPPAVVIVNGQVNGSGHPRPQTFWRAASQSVFVHNRRRSQWTGFVIMVVVIVIFFVQFNRMRG